MFSIMFLWFYMLTPINIAVDIKRYAYIDIEDFFLNKGKQILVKQRNIVKRKGEM